MARFTVLPLIALILLSIFLSSHANEISNEEDQIVNSLDSTKLWEKYRSELIIFLSKGKNNLQSLQLLPTPMNVNWQGNDETFQAFANSRMTPGALWKLDMNSFTSAYEEFINAIDFKFGNQKSNPKLDLLYNIEADKAMNLEMEEIKCISKFTPFYETIFGGYKQFQNEMCPTYFNAYKDYVNAKSNAEVYGKKLYPSEKDYIAGKAIGKFSMTPNPRFIELTKLSDFVKRVNEGNYESFQFSISSETSSTRGESSWKSTSFSLGFPGFFSVGYQSSKQQKSLTTNENSFKITYGAQSWTAVRVVPDPAWFSGSFLKEWANGPYKPGYNRNMFFGPNGKLRLIPQTFFIISKPQVEMILNKHDVEEFAKAKQSGFSIAIGPIQFNMSKAKTTEKSAEKDNLFRFKIESTDPTPQLIAVKGDFLPF